MSAISFDTAFTAIMLYTFRWQNLRFELMHGAQQFYMYAFISTSVCLSACMRMWLRTSVRGGLTDCYLYSTSQITTLVVVNVLLLVLLLLLLLLLLLQYNLFSTHMPAVRNTRLIIHSCENIIYN